MEQFLRFFTEANINTDIAKRGRGMKNLILFFLVIICFCFHTNDVAAKDDFNLEDIQAYFEKFKNHEFFKQLSHYAETGSFQSGRTRSSKNIYKDIKNIQGFYRSHKTQVNELEKTGFSVDELNQMYHELKDIKWDQNLEMKVEKVKEYLKTLI